jgi:hypothetical protein
MKNTIEKLAKLTEPSRDKDVDICSDYLQSDFTAEHIPQLVKIISEENFYIFLSENEYWIPLHAWRILGCLKAEETIKPLIGVFNNLSEIGGNWIFDEIPIAMGKMGSAAISPLSLFFKNKNNDLYARVIAIDGMRYIAENYPECREEVLNQYQHYIAHLDCSDNTFNGLLVTCLMKLMAVELMDDIRTLYQRHCIDLVISVDIEDVEIVLGLRQIRNTPRPRYELENMDPDFIDLLKEKLNAEQEIAKLPLIDKNQKIGRNAPCPCGSGKKYKKCCLY